MNKILSNQLFRPRRDIFVLTMVRLYYRMQYELQAFCGKFIEGKPTIIGFDDDLIRTMLRAMARTVVEDKSLQEQISKQCLTMPLTMERLRKTLSKMDIEWEFFTATRIYCTVIGVETFQDESFINEVYAYKEEKRTVNLHDALISIVLCLFTPFVAAGMNIDSMQDRVKRKFFYGITGNVLEDALSVMYGTFHVNTEKADDLDNDQSLYNRITSTCPDSLTKKFTPYIIDKVFHFVMKDTDRKDISYFNISDKE